ncbi:MAG: hypothetical protein ISS91_04185 [Candidatus Omnitrophica bacterium]|nr:hypothetical protein [Candidatus Omnitrophota bacterium]
MQKKVSLPLIFMIGCFITGNLVGAGILGLPIQTGIAGLVPSLVGMIFVGAAMFFSGVILVNEAVESRQDVFHFPSMYEKYFGRPGRYVAILANLVILYGFIIAYLTGSVSIITRLLGIESYRILVTLLFFAAVTAITISNPKSLLKLNSAFVIFLLISFTALVMMGKKYVQPARFEYKNWTMLAPALPIIVTAVSFQNVIPTISKLLGWNKKHIIISLLAGTFIGFLMCAVWIKVGIGVLPMAGNNSILSALENNVPEIVPLARAIQSLAFLRTALLFSLMAIITSYLSMGKALMEFIEDCTSRHPKLGGQAITAVIAFLPPLLIALVYPDMFLNLLNVIGGVGIVILFGMLPCIIALIKTRSRVLRYAIVVPVMLFFLAIFGLEVAQQTGLIKIAPRIKYWTNLQFYKWPELERKNISANLPQKPKKPASENLLEDLLPVDKLMVDSGSQK